MGKAILNMAQVYIIILIAWEENIKCKLFTDENVHHICDDHIIMDMVVRRHMQVERIRFQDEVLQLQRERIKLSYPPTVPESVSFWLRQLEYWERGITPLSPKCRIRWLVMIYRGYQKDVVQFLALICQEECFSKARVAAIAHASRCLVRPPGMTSRKELAALAKLANAILRSDDVDPSIPYMPTSPVALFLISREIRKSQVYTTHIHDHIKKRLRAAADVWDSIVEARKSKGKLARVLRKWVDDVTGMTGEFAHDEMARMAAFATEQLREDQFHLIDGKFKYNHHRR